MNEDFTSPGCVIIDQTQLCDFTRPQTALENIGELRPFICWQSARAICGVTKCTPSLWDGRVHAFFGVWSSASTFYKMVECTPFCGMVECKHTFWNGRVHAEMAECKPVEW